MNKIIVLNLGLMALLFLAGCGDSFLDVKYDKRLEVAGTVKDYQAMLDAAITFNQNYPSLGEISTTDYYLEDARWNALPYVHRSAYVWQKEIFDPMETSLDWNESYRRIHNTNAVIEGIGSLSGQAIETDAIRGSALFYRGYTLFELAQVFCTQWDEQTAAQHLGLPIRLTSDINYRSKRSSLGDTYEAILSDMQRAIPLLPERTLYKTRPSKATTYGMLARIHLQMEHYEQAYRYADSCLQLFDGLIDYNVIDRVKNYPFARLNEEVLFHSSMLNSTAFSQAGLNVAPELLDLYAPDDLRKEALFRETGGRITYKGSYNGSAVPFNGLTTAEILLIRAESACRLGMPEIALTDLDLLLSHRISSNSYVAPAISDGRELLLFILSERRRELAFRGIRWKDLRRLNRHSDLAVTLERMVDGQTFRLEPNDRRYVLPIPYDALTKGGLEQNER